MVKYASNHSVTETAIRYKVSRKTVYKWAGRYDGTLDSLGDISHRPHVSPRSHTDLELKLIRRRMKKHKWRDLLLAYQELQEKDGYARSYGGFKRAAAKLRALKPKKGKKARKPKPYRRADYPGQKVQVDVKYVPCHCPADGRKYYQYTAVDECSRWAFREMYEENNTYSARDFLLKLIKSAPFPLREVQTDNGTEFTNRLLVVKSKHLTLFEDALLKLGIIYSRIQIATPRHNGKVERQHRTDGERFYEGLRMYNLEDGRRQLAAYQKKSNGYIKTCLGFKSPNQVVEMYRYAML
jgi:transposase